MIYNLFIGIGAISILGVLLFELWYQKKYGIRIYDMADTITNAACGLSDRVFNIFLDTFQFIIWSKLYGRVSVLNIPYSVASWLLCLVVVDFIWYWYHRLGHEVRLFWAVHSLHHQSEQFNISVGFRISIFQSMLRGVFWLILPIIGFHPDLILTVLVFHGFYQLPLHTRANPKLGFLEYIFVTPSAHRVYHGINEQYLDKNYGGIFIFWDRLFGTFAQEQEEVVYGITDRTGTLSFFQAHLYGFRQLIVPKNFKMEWQEKWRYLFSKPSYGPVGSPLKYKPEVQQFEIKSELFGYVLLQMIMASIITFFFILNRNILSVEIKSALVFFIGWTLVSTTLRLTHITKMLLLNELTRNIGIAAFLSMLLYKDFATLYFAFPSLVCILLSLIYLPKRSI